MPWQYGFYPCPATDEHNIVGVIDERFDMQLPDESFTHLAVGKVKACHVFVIRKVRSLDLIVNGFDLALCGLGFEKLRQYGHCGLKGGRCLFHEIVDGLGHAVHLQRTQHDNMAALAGS
jgi:hypothetical protein